MSFNWTKDVITGKELVEALAAQYGSYLKVNVDVEPTAVIGYKTTIIPYSCNRCGNHSSGSPMMLLNAFDQRGGICTKCIGLSDDQIKQNKEASRNEAALNIAKAAGDLNDSRIVEEPPKVISPDELESLLETTTTVEEKEEEMVDDDSSTETVEDNSTTEVEEDNNAISETDNSEDREEVSEEEFADLYKTTLSDIVEQIGFQPFDSTFNIVEEGGFTTKCMVCGEISKFSNFDDLGEIVKIDIAGRTIESHNCKSCINNLKQFGKIHSFETRVKNAVGNRGGYVVENKLALFNSPMEIHKIGVKGCDGIFEDHSIHSFMTKYGNMKDIAPMFREKFDNAVEEKRKIQQAESIKAKAISEKSEKAKVAVSSMANAEIVYTKNIQGANEKTDTLNSYEKEREEQRIKAESEQVFKETPKQDVNYAKLVANVNPFQFDQTLTDEFKNSSFSPFIEDLARITGVEHTVVINEYTLEIPFIDFESGIRIICVDLDDRSMYNVPFENIANRAYFSYKGVDFKWIILYSDSVQYRRTATLNNYIKLINPEVLPYQNKKIIIQDEYNVLYTNNQQFIKEFEEKNSILPMGKPMTGRVAILAQNNAANKHRGSREALSFASMLEYGKRGFKLNDLTEEYETYMVASIRYIEHFDKENSKVSYTITDYTEITTSFVADGFYLCIGALIREYRERYPLLAGMPPTITFERDPNAVPSSTLKGYIEKGTLSELDPFTKFALSGGTGNVNGANVEYKQCYVKLPEMRTKEEDSFRQDCRLFYPSTLIARMSEDLKAAGINSNIRDAATRRKFIKDQGYVPCKIIEVKEFMVAYDKLLEIMYNANIMTMQKLPDVDALMPLGGIVNGNSINENPFLMMKFMKMMNSDDPMSKDMMNKILMGQMMGNSGFNQSMSFDGNNPFGESTDEMLKMQMMMSMFNQ